MKLVCPKIEKKNKNSLTLDKTLNFETKIKYSKKIIAKNWFFIKNFLNIFKKYSSTTKYQRHPNFELKGGGKKRKKKTYTKPKKIKHIRKKIKLKTLNYYSVDDGKIKKLRRESPQSPGSFMAEHSDRLTCGKTGLTLVRKD